MDLKYIQSVSGKVLLMITVFLFGIGANGEWLMFLVIFGKDNIQVLTELLSPGTNDSNTIGNTLRQFHLPNVHIYILWSIVGCLALYWGVGCALNTHFYKKRREQAKEWKCQPDKWLTPANENQEFLIGSFNVFTASVVYGIMVCYIVNGGRNTLYLNISDHGWLYFLLTIPVFFIYLEASNFYTHWFLHTPWLYRRFHKLHHKYTCPTVYSVTAMHPLEFWINNTFLLLPLFLVPIHIVAYLIVYFYVAHYGTVNHSGIYMESIWPWHPSSMFHDDHHRLFHCNFGLNTTFLDRFHGTLRKKNRHYDESTFGGKGKVISRAADNYKDLFYDYSTSKQ